MKLDLSIVRNILSTQDYLSYEKILDEMIIQVKKGNKVIIEGSDIILSTEKEVDSFNKKMIQVHGIYGLV